MSWPEPLRKFEKSPRSHSGSGNGGGQDAGAALPCALFTEKEEGAITSVVKLRDRDGAAASETRP